ncbi:MAG: OmpA family protein [Pelagimonas sp.]|jgi:OOP family OmpA-OmpF porin|nr:OmpA family protein [Pelagimonas sp.]
MRLSSIVISASTFVAAAAVSLVAAKFAVGAIETASRTDVLGELDQEGLTWAEVDTNGLQVFLIGTAPDEAMRFRALSVAGRVVDAARVIDQMLVEEAEELAPPRFSIEILRNDAGVSVIGLVPTSTDRAALMDDFKAAVGEKDVIDLLESADFPAPQGWIAAVDFATSALRDLPRSKISVAADRVAITAMSDSEQVRVRLQTTLNRRKPDDLELDLDISAPRPVISPFSLRFVIDEEGARFDACSADTEAAREEILDAAMSAGLEGKSSCTLGLGTPSRRWGSAASIAIDSLAELGGGTLTFANADIQLQALEGTDEALFDRVVGELENALPGVFALKAVLPKPVDQSEEGPPEFTATLSPEGEVQLRGRLASEIARQTADSYARARFTSGAVYTAARLAENLPMDWSARTLAGIEVLSMLNNGSVTVQPDSVVVAGQTGNPDAKAQITSLLSSKLGDNESFDIRVEYVERLDPTLGIPKPEECPGLILEIIGDRKIAFEPGAATLDASAADIMDDLAELLKKCGEIPLEIGGHTDSQGREVMNQQLSQERAQAVLDALLQRRVPTRSYAVKGYGETQPIADNGTAEGREENRRIEFKLLAPEPEPAAADAASQDGTPAAEEEGATATEDAAAEPSATGETNNNGDTEAPAEGN